MRLAKIAEIANRVGLELEAEGEVTDLLEEIGVESVSIRNARGAFRAVLKNIVPLFLILPKTKEELEFTECKVDQVNRFITGFHAAVMAELGKREFLEEKSDKIIYGRFVSRASNTFLYALRGEIIEERGKVLPLEEITINYDDTLMAKLAERNAKALQE
jgi:hypothetical protein